MKKEFVKSIYGMVLWLLIITLFYGCATEEGVSLEEQIDAIVLPRTKVGAMVGVINNQERLILSYGSKSINSNDPPDADTIFEIGSITKTFTATLLADTVLKGAVGLNSMVAGYLPAHKVVMPSFNGTEISFKHLATHTSGLPRMPDNFNDYQYDPHDPYAVYLPEYLYAFLNQYSLNAPIGVTYLYSNLGVGLLGHTLGLINGTSYRDTLKKSLFNVLDMNRSSLFLNESQKDNLALGHDENKNIVSNWNATDIFQGAGFIKSSMNDMLKYLEANMGLAETPLKPAMELCHQIQYDFTWGHMGLAWHIEQVSQVDIINHNGATGGYYAYIGFNKTLKIGVVVLCNTTYYNALDAIGVNILKILINQSNQK